MLTLKILCISLREKCPNTELFLVLFSCIQSEYRKIGTRKTSVFGNFSRSAGRIPTYNCDDGDDETEVVLTVHSKFWYPNVFLPVYLKLKYRDFVDAVKIVFFTKSSTIYVWLWSKCLWTLQDIHIVWRPLQGYRRYPQTFQTYIFIFTKVIDPSQI